MNPKMQQWDEALLDLEDYQAERALINAALDALRRARQCGTDFVVEEGGNTKSLRPDETAPYEERLLEDLDRLNRKVSELQSQSSTAPSLKDRPNR